MSEEVFPCFNRHQRDYLVSVTVHRARNIPILNSDTFVTINFNEETKKSKTFENSDCPIFNEYFVFELRTTLEELLKKNIGVVVFNSSGFLKKNSVIGEVNISLSTVWSQNYHSFVKKWAILEKVGGDNKNKTAGYLQLDLAIVSTNESPAPVALQSYNDEVIEDNLLLPNDSDSDPANVKYLISIFDGDFVVKRDYILQVSFGSTRIRTKQIAYSKYCQWNEQLIFQGKFQSMNQLIVFELLVHECYQWKVKCSMEINFSDMCWKTDEGYNKPSFGPSHIYFYEGLHKNLYYGKLLLCIATEEIDEKYVTALQQKQDIVLPLNTSDYWNEENFKINMIIINADALNLQQTNLKLNLSCGSIFSNSTHLEMKAYDGKLKVKFVEFESNVRSVLSLGIKLPDHRLKCQVTNLVKILIHEMETNIKNFKLFEAHYHDNLEYQLMCLKTFMFDAKVMLEGILSKCYYKAFNRITEWNENFLKYLRYTVEKCIAIIGNNKSDLKSSFREYVNIRDLLSEAISHAAGYTPDIFLNAISNGKLVAFHRFDMTSYFYSQTNVARGESCGKIRSIIMKPIICTHSCINCGCFFGKLDFLMWIGSEKEVGEWLPRNTVEAATNKVSFTIDRFYKCNVFVHQAKVQPQVYKREVSNTKLAILANGFQETTKTVPRSISAVWNEVIVIENLRVMDIGDETQADHPVLVMFLTNEYKQKIDIIGIASVKVAMKPIMKPNTPTKKFLSTQKFNIREIFDQFSNHFPPHLRWISFFNDGAMKAEVLMSAEFVHLQVPNLSVKDVEKNEPIPIEIRPTMKKFRLEVTFAGIRNASKLSQSSSGRYKIELTMGDLKLLSGFSGKTLKTNLNFLDPHASGYLFLPDEFQYWPSIVIKHLDCSHKNPFVLGAGTIRRPEMFFAKTKPKVMQKFLINSVQVNIDETNPMEAIEVEESQPLLGNSQIIPGKGRMKQMLHRLKFPKFLHFSGDANDYTPPTLEKEYTWWTKFYNSNRDPEFRNDCVQQLTIYHNELEKQPEFENLNDWAFPVDLMKGSSESWKNEIYATLKCSIKISECAGKEYFESGQDEKFAVSFPFCKQNLMVEQPIVVRAYIVQGLNLRPLDVNSYSDAFIKVELGRQVIADRAHYIPNQFNPVFGKRFQLSGIIPRNTMLKISVYDRDTMTRDDLIGTTIIDIEDRIRSKYLPICGLPNEFNTSGYNAWRNSLSPSEILKNICNEVEMEQPQYFQDHVNLAGIAFKDKSAITKDENKTERLALSALHSFEKIPGIGFALVPEHVETRSLYREDRPGVEQGKLQMWVEIYDSNKAIPEAIDITPQPARSYELRVTIWNTKDVILNEKNIFGNSMSDIYVKGWLHRSESIQYTDVHYRSLNGEGNFNWRLVFPLRYSVGEDMMVLTKKKNALEMFDTELKVPAVLNLQVWDNDIFTPDDFLGTLSVNISHYPKPPRAAANCSLKKMSNIHENLFAKKGSVRGWFPVYGKKDENETIEQTGKIELELEVLLEDKARSDPVGQGREGPNKLQPPKRPDTSFSWYSSPVKSIKHILWPQFRRYVIALCIALILILIFVVSIMIVLHQPQIIADMNDDSCNDN